VNCTTLRALLATLERKMRWGMRKKWKRR